MLGGARSAFLDGAPSGAPSGFPVHAVALHSGAFRILQSQLQLPSERIHRRTGALPRALRFETQIANASAPRSDGPADGAEVAAISVFLIQPSHHIRSNPDERA